LIFAVDFLPKITICPVGITTTDCASTFPAGFCVAVPGVNGVQSERQRKSPPVAGRANGSSSRLNDWISLPFAERFGSLAARSAERKHATSTYGPKEDVPADELVASTYTGRAKLPLPPEA